MEAYREYVGNLHNHTLYSSGTARHAEVAQAAEDAGLNFVITTDHNLWVQNVEGYYGSVLLLVGEEIHNVSRHPSANHLLVYSAEQELAPYAFASTQMLLQKAKECEGICFIAHPTERNHAQGSTISGAPWTDWPVEGITGLELWNYTSEFKDLLWGALPAAFYTHFPSWGMRGPRKTTLRLWDELLNKGQHLAALGNADAQPLQYRIGGQEAYLSYVYLFRCVNTHILTNGPLTGDLSQDKQLLYEALWAGRTWVGYDLPHSTRGFSFTARSGSARATVGEELKRLGAVTLEVKLPAKGEIRLLRNGKLIRRASDTELHYTSAEAGVYRVEVTRRFRGLRVGWIFSSPIYIS